MLKAQEDPALAARVLRRIPLRYAAGADPALDRPGHVRAGSSLARLGDGRLVVVQDDAHFLAVVDPATGLAEAVTLPAGVGGARQFDPSRGTKHLKWDLESCVVLPATADDADADPRAWLVALGSGSTARRERVLVAPLPADGGPPRADDVRLVDAAALYARLRALTAFAGAELNVEGAVRVGDRVRLLGRGNGAGTDDAPAVNATCDVPLGALRAFLAGRADAPEPSDAVPYALGALDDAPLGFTDATAVGDALLADAARWARLTDADGAPWRAKVEGLIAATPDGRRLWVVTDADDPDAPSELCEVAFGRAVEGGG